MLKKIEGFKKALIYVEGQGIVRTSMRFKDGLIVEIGDNISENGLVSLPSNATVVPGFIDQHIHGAAGFDTMDGTIEAIDAIAQALSKEGVVGFLPTTMTQSVENISHALINVKNYQALGKKTGAEVLGIHLEGPYISIDYIGAQPLEYVATPSIESFEYYNQISGNNIKRVTIAPEVEGSLELIKYLASRKITAAIGHTAAKFDEIKKAVEVGASSVTHTFNAMRPIHHREIGTVGASLMFDELNCEMICDLIHLSVPAIKLILKNKPQTQVTLVTDSMRAKHLTDGISELGGQTVIVKNGEARLENGTLAGSVLKMNNAIFNIHQHGNIPFCHAIDLATINPARSLNIDHELGSIKIGKKASITVLDNEGNICLTLREGVVIYDNL